MSMFIEVQSVEKGCPVIINLDHVIEIAPRMNGTCEIKMSDDGVSRSVMTVKNDYSMFKQFVLQTVSAEDISKRIDAINKASGVEKAPKAKSPVKIPKFDGTVADEE